MTKQEKLAFVDAFEDAYQGIAALLAVIPDEALRFTPPLPDAWSINDHLVHLLDADLAVCFRLRVAIAQPGFAIPLWEEQDWHDRLHYEAQDGRNCFGLARGLRTMTGACLRANAEHDWNEFWVQHPLRGKLGIIDLLKVYTDHGKTHEGYVKRNKEAWETRKK
jgi:hypothetical protein